MNPLHQDENLRELLPEASTRESSFSPAGKPGYHVAEDIPRPRQTTLDAAPSAASSILTPGSKAWRWVHVGVAALAMVLTLPGRTHGLGLFTEPLLNSLSLDRESYGFMNLAATLLGALFCLPCGWLLDRFGTRGVFIGVTTLLGATVVAMSWCLVGSGSFPLSLHLPSWLGGSVNLVLMSDLFVFLLLTRGLGQSALSVVSLALIGRAAGKRSGLPMGVFAFLTTAGFLSAFIVLGIVVKAHPDEWRIPWAGIGFAVLGLGLVGGLLIRNRLLAAEPGMPETLQTQETSMTLGQALRTPSFWLFSLTTSFYGLVVAGTSLFNESILAERGFDKTVFVTVTQIGIPFGLAANLLVGWLGGRYPLGRLMALASALFGAALLTFPSITTEGQVYVYACTLAVAGGAISVCFYSSYRQAFGPAHLGSIQGIAQMLTVVFSAVGPLIFASTKVRLGSYSPLFPVFAAIAFGLAILTWLVGMPNRPHVSGPVEEKENP